MRLDVKVSLLGLRNLFIPLFGRSRWLNSKRISRGSCLPGPRESRASTSTPQNHGYVSTLYISCRRRLIFSRYSLHYTAVRSKRSHPIYVLKSQLALIDSRACLHMVVRNTGEVHDQLRESAVLRCRRQLSKPSSSPMSPYEQGVSSPAKIGSCAVQMTFKSVSTTTIPPRKLPHSKPILTTSALSSSTLHSLSFLPPRMT